MVLEPLAFSVPHVSLDSRPMAGKMDRKPLEHAVPEEDRTGRLMEGARDQEPLEHSIKNMNLDSRVEFGTVRAFGSRPYTTQRWVFLWKSDSVGPIRAFGPMYK